MSDASQLLSSLAALAAAPEAPGAGRISSKAQGVVGSEILRIAAEIRARKAAGHTLCDLTVGDFDSRHFPVPELLAQGIHAALERGETNYPPSSGVLDLRQAVQRFYARELGLDYPLECITVSGGARPIIYGAYSALCDPGDRVVYPVPSWNNNHYTHLVGGVGVPVTCGASERFMPTPEALRAALPGARLLLLNSPLNPTGTMITASALLAICETIVGENEARARRGERPLYLLYDQIYWMLRFGGEVHVTPPGLVPEMARYTVFVDGISKAFAATGLRVGWGVGPADVVERVSALLAHVGSWAPRPEQLASAALLSDERALRDYHARFIPALETRLRGLHDGMQALKARGLPVDSIPPMGAIYLSARLFPFGRRDGAGHVLRTNEDVRRFLLERAGLGVVPFQAFGVPGDDGWFRLSVGAVSERDVVQGLERLEQALLSLRD
jgi:aspartate aminotransferase